MWIPRFVLVRWTPATKGNSCFNWNKKKCIETTSPNNLQLNNGVCEILNKDFSFILDPANLKSQDKMKQFMYRTSQTSFLHSLVPTGTVVSEEMVKMWKDEG
jgi:hypothetical protein